MAARFLYLNEDARILDMIRNGDEKALVLLFESNRKMVAAFVSRNNGTHDDEEDLLQEAVVILWEQVRSGTYEHASKLSTYLYGVVKNLWLGRLAKARREIPTDLQEREEGDPSASALDMLIENEETNAVREALEKIGDQCKKLLLLFYWEERSMEDIARRMGFANADTVKSKKYQCKKSLEQILRKVTDGYV